MAKKKDTTNKDVTQTGHLTYKDLQAMNNQNQSGYSDAYKQLLSNERINTVNNLTDWGTTPVRSNAYTQSGGKDYFGKSQYDPDIATENEFEDLNETRANNQSWWDALGNGVAKLVGKAGTTIAGTVGLVKGLEEVVASGFDDKPGVEWSKIWNNDIFDALDEADKAMEENFTVYATQAEQDADWWTIDYLTSKKFWADSVITNVGFTLGAMATGAGTAGLIGKGLSLFRGAAQLGKIGNGAMQLISSAVAASGEAAIEAKEAYKQYKEDRGRELNASMGSYMENAEATLQAQYTPLIQKAQEEYERNKGKLTRTREGGYVDLAAEKYKATMAQLQSDYQKELAGYQSIANERIAKANANIEQEAKSVGNKVMALNQGLLTAGNMIQFGKAFSKSYKNAVGIETGLNKFAEKGAVSTNTREAIRRAEQANARRLATETGETATREGVEQATETSGKALIEGLESEVKEPFMGKTRAALKGIVTEGSEEMNQQWISSGAQAYHKGQYKDVNDFWNDKYNKDAKDWDIANTMAAIVQGLDDSWGDPKQYEQFLVGAMMGGMGMPTITKAGKSTVNEKGEKVDKAWYNPTRWLSWEGGIYGELRDYNKQQQINKESNEALNTLLQDPKLQTTLKGIAERANSNLVLSKIQQAQNEAVENGDQKEYKDQEDKYFAHAINTFARAGRLDDLRAMYSYYAGLSDSEIENLIKENNQNNHVTAEQDKKNYTAQKMTERKKLMDALTEAQANKKKADEEGDTENSKAYQEQINSYAAGIQEINDAIDNYQGKEYYSPNIFTNEKGERKPEFDTNEKVKNYFKKNSDSLLSKIDEYERGVELIQEQFNGKLSDDKEDNLLYLWMRNRGSMNRFDSMYDAIVKSNVFPNKLTISRSETFKNSEGKEEKVDHKDAESLAKSMGLDADMVKENSDGNFEIDLRAVPKERAGVVLTRILASKENAALLNDDINSRIKGITDPTRLQALLKDVMTFRDAIQTYSDATEYWHTLQEYMRNPELVEEKKEEAAKAVNSTAKNEAIKKERLNSLVDKIASGQLNADDIANDEDVDDENKDKVKKAKGIADTYASMLQAIHENGESDEQVEVAKAMLKKAKDHAESEDDLMDLTKEEFNSLMEDDGDISPANLKIVKQMQAIAQGLSQRDAEDMVINGAKSLLQLAKESAAKKKAKAKATPKTKSEKAVEGSNTGVNDGVDPVIPNDDNTFILGKGSDKNGEYTIVARKGRAKGGRITYDIKYLRVKNGVVTEENGYLELDRKNVTIQGSTYYEDKGLRKPIKFGDKVTTLKIKSIQRVPNPNGPDKVYLTLSNRAYVKGKKDKKPVNITGYLKGKTLDDILGTPAGTAGAVNNEATPIVLYTDRDGTKMVTENNHIQATQGQQTEEELNQAPYIKIATSQYRWKYRDSETFTALKELKEQGKIPKDRQMITWDEYFGWKASSLEKSSSAKDKAQAVMYRRKQARAKVLWDFMNEQGVFDRRNTTTAKGKVTFGYSRELNDRLANIKGDPAPPVLLIFDENGNIIGDLVGPKDDAYSRYKEAGIDILYAKGQEVLDNNPQYDANGIVMIPNVSTSVKQHFIGTPNFTGTNNTLNSIMSETTSGGTPTEKPFKIGVIVGHGPTRKMALTPGRKTTDKSKEDKSVPLPPNADKHMGKPYLLIETSDPKRPYLPVSILMPSYSEATKGSKMNTIISSHLAKLKDVLDSKDSKQLIAWRDKLAELLCFEQNAKGNSSLFLNTADGNLQVSFRQEGTTVSDTLEDYENKSAEEIQNFVESLFTDNDKLKYPIPFNISRKHINTTGDFEGSGTDYNHVIGELAMTNLAPGSSRTVNDFISFNSIEEKEGEIVEKASDNKKKEKGTKQNPTSVITASKNVKNVGNGYVVPVQVGSMIDYRVCDKEGNIIAENDTNAGQLAATYCKAKGYTEGVHRTPYGKAKYNVTAQRFEEHFSDNEKVQQTMTAIYALQDKVHRDKTTSTHYYIEDENGELQEWDRLHAAIDEYFGKSWANDKRDKIEEAFNEAIQKINEELDKFNGTYQSSNEEFLKLIKPFTSLIGEEATNKVLADNGFNLKAKNDFKKLLDTLKTKAIDVQTGGHSYRALRAGQNYDEQARHFFKTGHVNYNDTSVFTREQLQEIERGLQAFKDAHPGWKFYTDNLVVTGTFNGKQVAGEIDMIGIDSNGDIYVFDFKTSADPFVLNGQKSDKFSNIWHPNQQRTTESQYTIQLSSYGNMVEQTANSEGNPIGAEVKGIAVVPTQFIYDNNGKGDGVAQVVPQPTIADMNYHKNVFGLAKDFFSKKAAPSTPSTPSKIKNPTQEQVNTVLSTAESNAKSQGKPLLSHDDLRKIVLDNFEVTQSEMVNLINNYLKNQPTSKENLNKNEPKTLEERIAIRSSLSGNGETSIFGKEGSDVWRKNIDGRQHGRKAGHMVPAVSHDYEGHQISIYDENSGRGGAISISLWRNPTQEEVTAIGELYKNREAWNGQEAVNKFAQAVDDILHGKTNNIPKVEEEEDDYGKPETRKPLVEALKPKGFQSINDAQNVILGKIGSKRALKNLKTLVNKLESTDTDVLEALNTLNDMLEDKDNFSDLNAIRSKEELKNLGKPKLRETDGSVEAIDINKEIEAVKKFIPNTEDATRIVESFLKIGDKEAYGMYINGVMSIARNAARGTLYHESFHFVVDKLMSPEEVTNIFAQARERWGNDKSDLQLEELLAEDFREYMQMRETFLGRMKLAWRRLGRMITAIANNKLYFDNLYRNIRKGRYQGNYHNIANRRFRENTPSSLREDMQTFLDNFGITINDVTEFGGEVKLFDALNKTINIRNANDITDGVGQAIAFMMQYHPNIREIISVLKTGSKTALVKYNFHKPFRLEISDYLYKYKTDKQQYLEYIGSEISQELRDLYNLKSPKESKSSIWNVIADFFKKLNPFYRYKVRAVHNVISPLVNQIQNNDPSFIVDGYTRPGETKEASLLNVEKAFRENPYEADIIKYLGENGIYLAGSTSIALAGTLYRQDENPLHDIDFQAANKSKQDIEKLLGNKFNSFKLTNTIKDKNVDSTTYTYLVLDRPFVEKRELSNIGVETIYDAETGEKLGTRSGSNLILKEGVQGKMLDFFTGAETFGAEYGYSTYNINGTYYKIADYREAMSAKVDWKREKDIWDYNRFISNDRLNKIAEYHHEKLEIYNLPKEQIQALLNRGYTLEEFNDMTDEEKETALACL